MVVGSAFLGAVSGLYDRYLMAPVNEGGAGLDKMIVQSWYTFYQCIMMGVVLIVLWWPTHKKTTPFHWNWFIVGVSLFPRFWLCASNLYLEISCKDTQKSAKLLAFYRKKCKKTGRSYAIPTPPRLPARLLRLDKYTGHEAHTNGTRGLKIANSVEFRLIFRTFAALKGSTF